MRVRLVVDANCDLPQSFIEENDILVLPNSIRLESEVIQDFRDPDNMRRLYHSGLLSEAYDAEFIPLSIDGVREAILDNVVCQYDFALIQTMMKERSPVFNNVESAMRQVITSYRGRRQQAGIEAPFSMRVVDTRTLFSGQGVVAAETVRLINENVGRQELRKRVFDLTANIHNYAVVQDVYYFRNRTRRWGDASVNILAAVIGKAINICPILYAHGGKTGPVTAVLGFESAVRKLFNYAERRIEKGLLSPYVCLSYAGDDNDIPHLPGFDRLLRTATDNGVVLMTCMMSTSGGAVNLGPKAVNLALCAEPHDFASFDTQSLSR
ncbi:DegV family protein [Ectopseudomonas mendocina]|nr:DegV family protein [Pseudomonas mendocina]